MGIKYIIFDMDGVLVNTETVHYHLWKRIFAEYGVDMGYDLFEKCIGSTAGYLFDLIKDAFGVDFNENQEVRAKFKQYKEEILKSEEGIPAIEGVTETLPLLKAKGYTMAIASSTRQLFIEQQAAHLGITDYFDVMFSAESVKNPKPAPDVFLAVAEMLGADPKDCIVVEDSTNGCLAGKSAGMKVIGFANPDSGNQDLSVADMIIYPFNKLDEVL